MSCPEGFRRIKSACLSSSELHAPDAAQQAAMFQMLGNVRCMNLLDGSGQERAQQAARGSREHGKFKIRSKKERGSVVALILPIMRIVAGWIELPADLSRRAG